jgi:hypothetical protein
MNFTYRTVTQDDQGHPLGTDPCHIRWETDDQNYSGIIAIPAEVFAGATQEEKIALVENEIRNIIQAKVEAQSFIFNGTATV